MGSGDGKGEGAGTGQGEGAGTGKGEGAGTGKGEDTTTNVAVGSAVAIAFTVIMCCIGIPMLIAGAVFVAVNMGGYFFSMGIAFLVIASLLTIGGIVLIVLICTGVCGGKQTRTQQQTTVILPATQGGQVPMQTQGGGYYPPAGQQYPPAGQQYPPAGQQYPPTGQQYPPTGQQYPPAGQQYPPNYAPQMPPPYPGGNMPAHDPSAPPPKS